MATIRRRKNNWQAVIRLKGYPAFYKTFTQKTDAKNWTKIAEHRIHRDDAGILIKKYPIFKEIVNRYLDEVSVNKRCFKIEQLIIKNILKERFCDLPLNKITPKIIADFRDRQMTQVKANTFNRRLDVVSNIFSICRKEWDYPVNNPCLMIKRPRNPEPRNRVLNQTEIRKLLSDNSLSLELRQIIIVALETGMRKSEILSIKREHINDNLLHIPITKTKSRTIPLTKLAQKTLLESHIPYRINVNTLGHTWRRLMRKHRLNDVCFHDLRHTALTNLFLKKSLTVPEVMLISGHSDPRILLKTYTNLKAQDLVEKIG